MPNWHLKKEDTLQHSKTAFLEWVKKENEDLTMVYNNSKFWDNTIFWLDLKINLDWNFMNFIKILRYVGGDIPLNKATRTYAAHRVNYLIFIKVRRVEWPRILSRDGNGPTFSGPAPWRSWPGPAVGSLEQDKLLIMTSI